jgi:hypothetical protein
MVQHNIPPCSESSSFDLLLWKSYVHTIFEVVASPHLAIEAQTAQVSHIHHPAVFFIWAELTFLSSICRPEATNGLETCS